MREVERDTQYRRAIDSLAAQMIAREERSRRPKAPAKSKGGIVAAPCATAAHAMGFVCAEAARNRGVGPTGVGRRPDDQPADSGAMREEGEGASHHAVLVSAVEAALQEVRNADTL